MFFFEAKNSRNMMEREKNIMKIRNLSKKGNRLKTDVLAVEWIRIEGNFSMITFNFFLLWTIYAFCRINNK